MILITPGKVDCQNDCPALVVFWALPDKVIRPHISNFLAQSGGSELINPES